MGIIFQKFGKDYDEELLESVENYMRDYDVETIEDINENDMRDYVLENFIYYKEVINYYQAWNYIGDGVRLNEALEMAYEFGYDTKSLNTELLATILCQENLRKELEELISEL